MIMKKDSLFRKWFLPEETELKALCAIHRNKTRPNYIMVAAVLNSKFENNRSASSCKTKFQKMITGKEKPKS